MLLRTCSNSWKRFIRFFSILFLLGLGMVLAVPTSSDSGGSGRWEWDEEQERRVFFPEGRGPHRPSPGMDSDISPNGVPSPYLEADPQYEQIYGWDWPLGNTVYVCVASSGFAADPTNPAQCDLYDASMVAYAPVWDPTYGMVDFDVYPTLDLQGGQYISMTDTFTTREHQVTNLTVTGADAVADTVSGTADPGTTVYVYEYDGTNWLYPIANGSGDWIADYNLIYDLLPGSYGFASQYDPDSDLTWWYWEVPNPTISANPVSDQISGDEWPEGEIVHVCVTSSGFAADPTIPAQCDYYDNAVVDPPTGPTTTYVSFDLSGVYDLQGGDYIAMTDTSTTKQHQVTNLDVTGVDPVTDIVSGTADPGSDVEVAIYDPFVVIIDVVANGSGDWEADLSSQIDLDVGMSGYATQYDPDSDETWERWSIDPPRIDTYPVQDWVDGFNWPEGNMVHLCINAGSFAADPTVPAHCSLYHNTMASYIPSGPGDSTLVDFTLAGIFDVQIGQYISLSDGTTRKDLLVANLSVTDWDVAADLLIGTADPSTDLTVIVVDCSGCWLDTTANGSGDWAANFSGIADLIPGDGVYLRQQDLDDDATLVYWSIPIFELYLPLIMR